MGLNPISYLNPIFVPPDRNPESATDNWKSTWTTFMFECPSLFLFNCRTSPHPIFGFDPGWSCPRVLDRPGRSGPRQKNQPKPVSNPCLGTVRIGTGLKRSGPGLGLAWVGPVRVLTPTGFFNTLL